MAKCDICGKEFEFVKQLYKDEDLENKKHLQKTGRSFIIDKDTKKIVEPQMLLVGDPAAADDADFCKVLSGQPDT